MPSLLNPHLKGWKQTELGRSANFNDLLYFLPHYRRVDEYVKDELNTRAEFLSRRTNSYDGRKKVNNKETTTDLPTHLIWSYQKVAWGHVKSFSYPQLKLGFSFANVMSDNNGNLTMYTEQRNVPKMPLLTEMFITNEGKLGSLYTGKFTFTLFPGLTQTGLLMGTIEKAFFTPGEEVELSWGWSIVGKHVPANNAKFNGLVGGFYWNLNPDLSITAECTVYGLGHAIFGQSSDQTISDDLSVATIVEPNSGGALGLRATSLSSIITKDLAAISAANTTAGKPPLKIGQIDYYGSNPQPAIYGYSGQLAYWAISLPLRSTSPSTKLGLTSNFRQLEFINSQVTGETIYYVSLGDLVYFLDRTLDKWEENLTEEERSLSRLFKVICDLNLTELNTQVVSAYPAEIFFPDPDMGSYGTFRPYNKNPILREFDTNPNGGVGVPRIPTTLNNGLFNIGKILIGTDFLLDLLATFSEANTFKIAQKNILNLLTRVIQRINFVTGDIYQFNLFIMDKISPTLVPGKLNNLGMAYANASFVDYDNAPHNGTGNKKLKNSETIITIEDTNIAHSLYNSINNDPNMFVFDATIFKPLIRSIDLSCKPPSLLMSEIYVQARAGKLRKVRPNNNDGGMATASEKDVDAFKTEYDKLIAYMDQMKQTATDTGFHLDWSERFRANLLKLKRLKIKPGQSAGQSTNDIDKLRGGIGAHWLNAAVYPIELKITIDGIAGFRYGDNVKTSLIPAHYREKYDMKFCVTKVTHSIKNLTWETTLHFVARVDMWR